MQVKTIGPRLAALAVLAAGAHGAELGKSANELMAAGARALAERVLFDEPGDGALWALGGTRYKARFDARGATYFPYLGARAPKGAGLGFALRDARRGSESIELTDAEPRREGSLVSYERGAVVEYYELRPDSMEQRFRVDALEGEGDLVLNVAVATELACFADAAGLRFEGELGGATYSRAVAFDAAGVELETETRWLGGEIEIRVPAERLATAALPLTIDPVIASFGVTNDASVLFEHADVAYDSTTDRFAVVYARWFSAADSDVLCTLYEADGTAVAGSLVGIDVTADCWKEPSIAANCAASQFLVAASTSPNCGSISLIEGRTRAAGSNSTGAQFAISDSSSTIREHPTVGGNPGTLVDTYYCVVWQVASKGVDDLRYQIVRTSSTLLFGAPAALAVGLPEDRYPSISKTCGREPIGTQRWNVVWQRGDYSLEYDVYGAQIQWSGAITTPAFAIDASAFDDRRPRASSPLDGGAAPRPWMVVFERHGGADEDVFGALLSEDDVLESSFNLSLREGAGYVAQNQSRPAVDSDGQGFLVTYREHFFGDPANRNVHASSFRVAANALVPIEAHVPTGLSFDDQDFPAIAASHAGRAFVAWQEERPLQDTWAIEGAVFQSIAGDAAGTPLCFGDGSGSTCPCGNASAEPTGCVNGTGLGGRLGVQGSNRIPQDDLVLVAEQLPPGQPGLFFQGRTAMNGGNGLPFGDGIRCCAQLVVRLQVRSANAHGTATSTVPIAATGGVSAGDTRCYQLWYRDPASGPCGTGFNYSNAYEVRWGQ